MGFYNKECVGGFSEELQVLKSKIYSQINPKDFEHLKKIERRGRLCSFIGYATIWMFPNLITAFLISFGHFTRWLIAHHVLHRGYDKVPNIPKRYTSKYFAKGWRRFIDWFDWLHPSAWDYEHNQLHHFHTSEEADPDLVERHTEFLRGAKVPYFIKYIALFFTAITWKYTYYAPNTMSVLCPDRLSRIKKEHIAYITIKNILDFRSATVRRLWVSGYLPYGIVHFVILPMLFLPFGSTLVFYVLINRFLAECLTNLHSFIVIGPNHAGEDLYRFDYHYDNKEQFYVNQILTSVNYRTGNDVVDHLQIWLNYQIEHHLFPDLPMLKYQQVQPAVKSLCEKYGIPYIQEGVFTRLKKMTDVCVGKTSMTQVASFEYEDRNRDCA